MDQGLCNLMVFKERVLDATLLQGKQLLACGQHLSSSSWLPAGREMPAYHMTCMLPSVWGALPPPPPPSPPPLPQPRPQPRSQGHKPQPYVQQAT